MARRQRISASDYAVDDYGGEDYYDQEYDQEEQAIRESKKLFKQQKKAQKSKWRRFRTTLSQLVCCAEAKGVQETDIDALEALFPGVFTREQIKGTLENYKNDKDQAIA